MKITLHRNQTVTADGIRVGKWYTSREGYAFRGDDGRRVEGHALQSDLRDAIARELQRSAR
jgi:hypothetical protein